MPVGGSDAAADIGDGPTQREGGTGDRSGRGADGGDSEIGRSQGDSGGAGVVGLGGLSLHVPGIGDDDPLPVAKGEAGGDDDFTADGVAGASGEGHARRGDRLGGDQHGGGIHRGGAREVKVVGPAAGRSDGAGVAHGPSDGDGFAEQGRGGRADGGDGEVGGGERDG